MEAMRLFKLLQKHVGVVNEIAAKIYNEQIAADEAHANALAEIEATLAKMKGA